MRRFGIIFALGLAGCSPQLDDLPKLSSADVADAPQTLSAVPSVQSDQPLGETSDVQAAIAAANLPAVETSAGGLFGALRRVLPGGASPQDQARQAAIAPKAEILPQSDVTLNDVEDATQDTLTPVVTPVAVATPEPAQIQDAPEKKGIFGLFTRKPAPEADPEQGLVAPEKAQDLIEPSLQSAPDTVIEASVKQPALATPQRARRALFSPRKPSVATGPDAQQVQLGATLPYGQIARVCGAQRGSLGREIGRFPDRGKGYRLYDSKPGSTALRPHYITGFSDGCVRQFSAALAMFGGTEFHEQVRYQRGNRDLPFTPTDLAYENLKSKLCRVGKNTPCPSSKVAKLQKDTVFVSVYERFGSNPRWADILLHDGQVLAKDIKAR